jgi:peptide deformylase
MRQSKAVTLVPPAMAAMESGVRDRPVVASIRQHPDPVLGRPSYDVDPTDPRTVEIAAALVGSLRRARGCLGLSAPQLGHHVRVFCVDVAGHSHACSSAGMIVLANPELLAVSGKSTMREGCASVGSLSAELTRAREIVLAGVIPGSGRRTVVKADALEARCILHALDHLDGILFLDRIEPA